MARVSSTPDSSCIFMGNPIVYTVVPSSVTGTNIAFHRVKMTGSINDHQFELSQPVDDNTGLVEFDISSWFRSAAELYEYNPVTSLSVAFPVFSTANVRIKDVWVEEGVLREGGEASVPSRSAIIGEYSDYERSRSMLTGSLSRKPVSGELLFPGDTVVYATGTSLSPASMSFSVPTTAAGSVTAGGRQMYAIPFERNSVQFQFVNSRGCIESIRAWHLDTEKMKSETKKNIISKFERFTSFSRTYQNKLSRPSEFAMSSGFVSYQWAKWWAYEFCMARRCWMLADGQWIPCHITVDDTTTVIDRSKVGLCSVQFTVSPDLNGALW